MRWRKFSDDDFLEQYKKGLNDIEIAYILGVTPPAVGDRRNKLGLKSNFLKKKVSDEELIEIYQKGYNDHEIAKILGILPSSVNRRRVKLGLKSTFIRNEITDTILIKYYNRGYNDTEIAKKVVVGHSSISRRRRKLGLSSNLDRKSEKWSKKMRQNGKKAKIPNHHTTPELQFMKVCEKYNLPFEYVGDNKYRIPEDCQFPQKNPDFIHEHGKKIVIEIFGADYYHNPLKFSHLRYNRTYQGTIEHYKRYEYKCIIFWGNELKNEELVLERLNSVGVVV